MGKKRRCTKGGYAGENPEGSGVSFIGL